MLDSFPQYLQYQLGSLERAIFFLAIIRKISIWLCLITLFLLSIFLYQYSQKLRNAIITQLHVQTNSSHLRRDYISERAGCDKDNLSYFFLADFPPCHD